jgi:hypothetical protein
MDRKQLESKLDRFVQKCKEDNYPLESLCLVENVTDFTLEVKSKWIDELNSCTKAINILTNILWETTDVETRKKIFAISILDIDEQPHCYEELTLNN